MGRVLILAGTEEARELANRLDSAGADIVVALKGRTSAPRYPGDVRVGGFGGDDGLTRFLSHEGIGVVVDATHPFAARISPAAERAARATGAVYLRLERPPWRPSPGARWTEVDSLAQAARTLDEGARVFLAVGAGGLAPFLARRDLTLVARTIEAPDLSGRDDVTVIRDRGPFTLEGERDLFVRYALDALVTKNAGGAATAAKLEAARERGMRTLMVRRPARQPAPTADTVDAMMRELHPHLRAPVF